MLRTTLLVTALVAVSQALSAPYAEIADIADSSMKTDIADASMKTDTSMKTDISMKADAQIIIPNQYFSPTNHSAHPGDEIHHCTDIDLKLSTLKRSHMGGGAYCCDICDVAFTPSHDPLVVPATGDETKEERLCCPTLNTTDGEGITVYLNASSHYYAHNKCPNCEKSAWHGCKGVLAAQTVGTVPIPHDESRFGLELSITNLTEYSPVWPMANHEDHKELERLGYLQNGLKSDGEEAHDLLQMSLCNNRYVKNQMCFGTEVKDDEYKSGYRPVKVKMGRAAIRIFVLDHAGNTPWVKGPDALQFNCTGGTFSLFGDHPYISYTAGQPILEEEDFTVNGQSKYTYLCPDNDIPVTIWSKFTAQDSFDNPHTSNMPNLTKAAEDAMVLIEYEDVDCVAFTFANMPPRYTQNGYTSPDNPAHNIDAWVPDAEASLGGNPLNSSNELSTAGGFTDISTAMCEPTGYGRNWVMAGYSLDETTAPCTDLRLSQDPMFVVNGEHRHFWLPTGETTPLLAWENNGVKLVLKGETFGNTDGHTQWFGNFSVFADHHEIIRINVRTGAMKLGKEHKKLENQTLNTMEVFVDGNEVTGFGKVKSGTADCSITASKLPVRLIGHAHAESIDIDVPGLSLTISSAKAGKYGSNTARQMRYAHLNMKMRSSLPPDPSGLVAELAGFNPLSKKTKEYLRVPKAVKEHRAKMKGKKGEKGEQQEDEEEEQQQQQQQQEQQQSGRGKKGKKGKSGGGVLLGVLPGESQIPYGAEPDSVFDLP